jgi:putative transposase
MGRPLRNAVGGVVYHVLNRANGQTTIFELDAHYAAFMKILAQAAERTRMRLLSYCVMTNHWHLVAWPRKPAQNESRARPDSAAPKKGS